MNLTPTGFGVIVAILLVLAVIVVIADELRTRHEDEEVTEETPPAYDDTCAIDYCNRYATTLFPSSTGVIFVCRKHAGQVSEWTGPAVFDNEQESA